MRCDVAQDFERLLGRGRFDEHLLKAAFEGRVALDVLAVFVERRGADGLQLTPCQGRFEDVGRIEAALRGAGPDDGVDLVDEQDRVARAAQLVHELLHALLELAAELGARHQRGDVERVEVLALDRVGDIPRSDPQGQPLYDRALADAGCSNQDRVVLLAARKDLHDALDLLLAPHHGVDLPLAGHAREVYAEFVEHLRRRLLRFVRLVEIEHVGLRLGGVELLARCEPLHLGGDQPRIDVVHLQHACGDGAGIARYVHQGVGRRDAPHGSERAAELVGITGDERLGLLRLALRGGLREFASDAQPDLVKFPVLEPRG